MRRDIINGILSAVNTIIPKKNKIIFSSFPDLSGNAIALYSYIVKNRPDITQKFKLLWTVTSLDIQSAEAILEKETDTTDHIIMKKKSIKGIIQFFTSQYIVSTHGYFSEIQTAKQQIHINLWHGMPFKRIGKMLEEVHSNGKKDSADMTISTSETFQQIMAQSFGIPKEKVLITGQPVNDYFFSGRDALRDLGIDRNLFNKIVIWLPTYRTSVIGDIREDGKKDSFGVIQIVQSHLQELLECLSENNWLLLVKPHPMDELCRIEMPESDYFRVIKNEELSDRRIQLNQLLGGCDLLLTDYSSVFIDFLITGKPIAFICDDMEAFADSRGFCFENPREYMPGELITDFEKLLHYFTHAEELNERWRQKYEEIAGIFNPMKDSSASKRVCDAIWGKAPISYS